MGNSPGSTTKIFQVSEPLSQFMRFESKYPKDALLFNENENILITTSDSDRGIRNQEFALNLLKRRFKNSDIVSINNLEDFKLKTQKVCSNHTVFLFESKSVQNEIYTLLNPKTETCPTCLQTKPKSPIWFLQQIGAEERYSKNYCIILCQQHEKYMFYPQSYNRSQPFNTYFTTGFKTSTSKITKSILSSVGVNEFLVDYVDKFTSTFASFRLPVEPLYGNSLNVV